MSADRSRPRRRGQADADGRIRRGRDHADPDLLGVGRIVKPHGLRGDVIVSLSTNRDERVAPGRC